MTDESVYLQMKILYVSCRYNPLDGDAGSGVDYGVIKPFEKQNNEIRIVGPFKDYPAKMEILYRRIHRLFSKKLTAKFSEAYLHLCATEMDNAAQDFQPDFIFTHNLIPLVYSKSKFPVAYYMDTVLFSMFKEWPTYSRMEYWRMLRWEKRALGRASFLIVNSQWAANDLLHHYRIPENRILVTPIPSALPDEVIPKAITVKPLKKEDLRLLLVGRDYKRKGIDTAIQLIKQLRSKGINASLRIVGLDGVNQDGVEFMGLYKKSDSSQLREYVSNYQWAHFLIHPAIYEAAGIVCGEAAAFGVPTITNDAGGLATTVEDGLSGVVLPKHSAADKYADSIVHFLQHPKDYQELCIKTRKRYEKDLNSDAVGEKILSGMKRIKDNL